MPAVLSITVADGRMRDGTEIGEAACRSFKDPAIRLGRQLLRAAERSRALWRSGRSVTSQGRLSQQRGGMDLRRGAGEGARMRCR